MVTNSMSKIWPCLSTVLPKLRNHSICPHVHIYKQQASISDSEYKVDTETDREHIEAEESAYQLHNHDDVLLACC